MADSSKDDARAVLADPRAPQSEVFDAQSELGKAHQPSLSDMIPSADVLRMIDVINDGLADQAMLKGGSAQIIPFPGEPRKTKAGMQSTYVDDLQVFTTGRARDKPSPLGFAQLREMVEQTPVLAAIVGTRMRQVSRFTQPSEDGLEGFEIRHVDKDHKMTPAEKDRAKLIGRFIQNSGWEFNPRKRKALKRQTFAQMMRARVRDSLAMDAAPIEIEWKRDRAQGIDGLYAIDGATIGLCTDEGYEGDDKVVAVQEVEGRVTTTYTQDNLIYEVRNPRTDVRLAGYGFGEAEQLIRVVTGILNAMNTNIAGFDNNAIPRGVLQLSGDYDAGDLASFKRSWNNQVKGINGRWAVPVMVNKDGAQGKVEWTNFGVDFNEMMFAKWMTFLTSLACAIWGMDPGEINFESFAASKSSLSGSDTEEKLTSAKDSGLHPDMAFFEAEQTDYVVSEFDQDLCFRWVGLREEDKKWQQEYRKLAYTVNELRAVEGDDPYPKEDGLDLGTAPLNPALLPAWQAKQQADNPQPGQEFGAGAPPPPPPGPDFGDPDASGDGGDGAGSGDPAAAGAAGAADVEGAKPEFGGPAAGGARPAGAAPGAGGADFGKAEGGFGPIFVIGEGG